ncbi:(S)-coclaurine N-methyltransferase isoform X2 [Eurytemora carolleeae]|uniref:(S)-coclaurine N-methyltransferase isoform X2 n=1 Tax=Eurytemora carolleeae TaxID=1294199 RepID=UPI000C75BC21|nr:(S)-coclaurine N-methyltransferase isoform X2 [Eurytemora carolleeae]|eukprot:XP_023321578.1 (S)-coclaurine N-methyltransferase-like isoform X2 [Eurytemora affinis]
MLKMLTKMFWWLLLRGWIPDYILRWKIRSGLKKLMLSIEEEGKDYENRGGVEAKFVNELKSSPIAVCQQEANQQHYELKYSSCFYPTPTSSLAEAEIAMLDLYIHRSGMKDGMDLLDLGCGWGSVALHFAQKFKNSRIIALSNSKLQKAHIDQVAREKGLTNLIVYTGDITSYQNSQFAQSFDRIISIEMFEHMKNYEKLLEKISAWLKCDGKLFVHIFTHKWKPYHFEKDWMARTFFTGGTMPSHSLLLNFQKDLLIENQWGVSGTHYSRTLEAWLELMDRNIEVVTPILKQTYGEKWRRWWLNWRLFFIVCSETFGIAEGSEWGVSHYLFSKR